MTETIELSIGGGPFTQWKDLSIKASVQEAARSFSVVGTLQLGGATAAQLFPPAAVTIKASGTLLFTGSVDRYQPKLNATEVGVTVSGRSKAANAVDSSVDHTKPDYVNKTLLQIAQDQDTSGIGFSADFQMTPIDRTRPNIGESLFEFCGAHIDNEMCTMAGQADGSIKFTRAGVNPPRQPGQIIEGQNFFYGEADHDWSKRHSKVHCHGQAHKGSGASSTQIQDTESDDAVTSQRELHIVHPGNTDQDRVTKRAKNHLNAAAGNGTRLSYKASTWRDSTGALWLPGNKVWVEVPSLSLVQDMLIESVTWKSNDKGEYADLDLVDPQAHGGKKGGVIKSSSIWSTPS